MSICPSGFNFITFQVLRVQHHRIMPSWRVNLRKNRLKRGIPPSKTSNLNKRVIPAIGQIPSCLLNTDWLLMTSTHSSSKHLGVRKVIRGRVKSFYDLGKTICSGVEFRAKSSKQWTSFTLTKTFINYNGQFQNFEF